ncbi:hypothetical protein SAMN05192533_101259 [Mesobacillus persicus]|uniref:Uncharacterized protein n=1 Tax=Mesobacillus persicus TaxID=930146 RepID=A0A1H7W3X0_9BACI|nr:hypothetical protein SAMN05192533_101259 [Mesobacillus persicus]
MENWANKIRVNELAKKGVGKMKKKEQFLEGAKVTQDNQIFGTPNSKSKNGTGDSPNDNVNKGKSNR